MEKDEHSDSSPSSQAPVHAEKIIPSDAEASEQPAGARYDTSVNSQGTEYTLPKQTDVSAHSYKNYQTDSPDDELLRENTLKHHRKIHPQQQTQLKQDTRPSQQQSASETYGSAAKTQIPPPPQSPGIIDNFHTDDSDDEEEAIDFFKYIGILFRRRYAVMAVTLLSMLFSVYRYTTSDKYYISNARLLFSPDQQDISNDYRSYTMRIDRDKQLNTHLELLKSPTVLAMVVENIGTAITTGAIFAGLSIRQGETDGEKNDIVELSYKNRDPEMTRDVLNELCRTYIDYRREVNSQEVRRLIVKLETQIDKLQTELDNKENTLRFFKEDNRMIQLSSESNITISKLTEMELALQKTNLDIIENRERQQELKSQISTQELNIVQSMTYSDPFKNRLSDLELELNTLSAEYSPEHYKVKSVKEQIERLKDATVDSISREAASKTLIKNPIRQSLMQEMINLSIEIAALETKRIAQEKIIERLNTNLLKLPQLEQRYVFLQRETESSLQTLRILKNKYEEAKIRKDSQESDLKVLEMAQTPVSPIRKVRITIIFIGILAGLIIGIALALVIEYLDQSLKDPLEVEKSLELPLLGIVPHIEANQELLDQKDLSKNIFEPFRALRANLKHIASTHKLKTFIICSAVKGEGKTTLSANLSITFAMDGKKVILIDADLRRSQMHTLFNVPKKTGLSDYLLGSSTIDEILKPTKYENLLLITSGERPHNPAELLGTFRFDKLIEELREKGDIILFDSPALLPVSDTITMAPKMDGCLVVVRTLWTPVKAARQAKNQLKRIGCRIFGGILNGVVHSKGYYPYYYGYYGYYSYKYTYDDDTPRKFSIREFGLKLESNLKAQLRSIWLGIPKFIARSGVFVHYVLSKPMLWILLIISMLLFIFQIYLESNDHPLSDETIQYLGLGRTTNNPDTTLMYNDIANLSRKFPDVLPQKKVLRFSDSIGLEDSLRQWLQARERSDTSRLFRFYHPEFTFSGGAIDDWKKNICRNLVISQQNGFHYYLNSFQEKEISDNYVEIDVSFKMNGKKDTSDNSVTLTWKKYNSNWRIVRERPSD
jgi:tyrosine-protein kinase Etk/Wzc